MTCSPRPCTVSLLAARSSERGRPGAGFQVGPLFDAVTLLRTYRDELKECPTRSIDRGRASVEDKRTSPVYSIIKNTAGCHDARNRVRASEPISLAGASSVYSTRSKRADDVLASERVGPRAVKRPHPRRKTSSAHLLRVQYLARREIDLRAAEVRPPRC